jgi:3-methyl-2-oxobutanoate hydroxymethyltransferase
MSVHTLEKRMTPRDFRQRKQQENAVPLVAITAYTAPMAALYDPHVDMMLVGDSLGMVIYGFDSTLPVTLDMMVAHGQAVVRGSSRALVVVDMPFASYQESPQQAFRSAARLLQETGCGAVKLEGGREMAETVAFLVKRGIPVQGHIGVTPQSVNEQGYRARGRTEAEWKEILADAKALEDAGAFSVVAEAVLEPLGKDLTERSRIPIIGIGASPTCDGQVIVGEDILGLTRGHRPKFVKTYASLGEAAEQAVATYADEVRRRAFPAPEQCYGLGPNPR